MEFCSIFLSECRIRTYWSGFKLSRPFHFINAWLGWDHSDDKWTFLTVLHQSLPATVRRQLHIWPSNCTYAHMIHCHPDKENLQLHRNVRVVWLSKMFIVRHVPSLIIAGTTSSTIPAENISIATIATFLILYDELSFYCSCLPPNSCSRIRLERCEYWSVR